MMIESLMGYYNNYNFIALITKLLRNNTLLIYYSSLMIAIKILHKFIIIKFIIYLLIIIITNVIV